MALDSGWIIFITTIFIYAVFLLFDIFKRDEPYGNLAYVIGAIPANYLWFLLSQNTPAENMIDSVILIWIVIVGLWLIAMLRDMILVMKKKKSFDSVVKYLIIGIIVQIIAASVLPSEGVIDSMAQGSIKISFFWLPDLFNVSAGPMYLNIFRILVTLLVIGVVIPMVSDLKGEPINMWALLIITLIFSIPFLLICYLWLPKDFWALLFLVEVMFFTILLLLTRGGSQNN